MQMFWAPDFIGEILENMTFRKTNETKLLSS